MLYLNLLTTDCSGHHLHPVIVSLLGFSWPVISSSVSNTATCFARFVPVGMWIYPAQILGIPLSLSLSIPLLKEFLIKMGYPAAFAVSVQQDMLGECVSRDVLKHALFAKEPPKKSH